MLKSNGVQAGRVWRDGQKKKVYVYRFLTTGTIEEKVIPPRMTARWCSTSLACCMIRKLTSCLLRRMQVYQRQLSKEGLQSLVNNASSTAGASGLPAHCWLDQHHVMLQDLSQAYITTS